MDNLDNVAASYDAIAADYSAKLIDELAHKPLDRALLQCFAALVGDGLVADIGCGPGQASRYLADLGLRTVGLDASGEMIAHARRLHPQLAFDVADMRALGVADHAWDGIVAAYSIIHLDAAGRDRAFAEFARTLRPGGWLLLSFHVSDADHEPGTSKHVSQWLGTDVDFDGHFLDPDDVSARLTTLGCTEWARATRGPMDDGVEYPSRRAYLIAQR